MTAVLSFFADQPLLFTALVVGLGVALGRIRYRGVGLGPAAVLFTAMVITAWGTALDVDISIPEILGNLGLVLFAFTTGLMAGPTFFATLRTAWHLVVTVTLVVIAAAATAQGLGTTFGLSPTAIAGTFAGAVTNTPALAATGGSPQATVGYATTYLLGVVTMLVMVGLALAKGREDPDSQADVVDVTVRVDRPDIAVADLRKRHGHRITFSRVAHDSTTPPEHVHDDSILHHGDLVTAVGPADEVEKVADELGHRSSHDLTADRSALDFRRITISAPRLAGRRVRDLELDRHDGSITRVRRGDEDLIANVDTVLQLGDRVRVVAPPERMADIARELGDSSRGMTELNAAALGLGIAAGIGLGVISIPVPFVGSLSLGAAAGTLIVGLVLGRLGRIGPVATSMPLTSAQVVSEIGLLLFLAYAGERAGSLILTALTGGEIVDMLVTGIVTAAVLGVGMFAACRWVLRVGRLRMAGVLAGSQTNPAHLAFANARGGGDPRIALGYALVYPAAMVVKIIAAQVICIL
ncbi:aspartate:alanine exchanger family transporter [Gordonia sp. ABSL49_1]|uniref:aspartate:alanine exchanger family transporter n=1 Tax=Gordonia sp. ABSL49_1 TaxID=2920941 RepID=UPI001F0F37E5|nr:TrkA C-terminal domain-containing protein [Gordonia sp. ABSL49_1]MCH5644353.1 AAE family transporter [Gordonia sp. ABSL49_1]